MTQPRRLDDNSLVDLLDRLVQTGVVATGDVVLGLADVDLIRVNLQLVLGAVDTLMADEQGAPDAARHNAPPVQQRTEQHSAPLVQQRTDLHSAPRAARTTELHGEHLPASGTAAPALQLLQSDDDGDRADLGVGGLLVAVIEIVHRLLERQAIHRMERGSLTSEQTERLGQALMALDQRINQLIEIFGVRSSSALPATVAGTAH